MRMLKATAKCQYCGNDFVLPFKCSYCGGLFCAEHRIPESHACPETWRAKAPREAPPMSTKDWSKPSYKYTVSYTPQSQRIFWFSPSELKHLILGTLLVLGVGLSYFIYSGFMSRWLTLVSLSVAFTLSFLLHEIAHKFSAQHFQLWAEFRLTVQGALITFISIFLPPPFKIISPGAVMILGSVTKEIAGKTALSGPLTNILISTGCVLIATFTQDVFWIVAFINAILAAFNLIPFGIMDGLKVFRWNRMVWALTSISAIILTAYTYGAALSFF